MADKLDVKLHWAKIGWASLGLSLLLYLMIATGWLGDLVGHGEGFAGGYAILAALFVLSKIQDRLNSLEQQERSKWTLVEVQDGMQAALSRNADQIFNNMNEGMKISLGVADPKNGLALFKAKIQAKDTELFKMVEVFQWEQKK